jgi:hypothetical protein
MTTAQRTAYEAALREGAPDFPPPFGMTLAELATAIAADKTRVTNSKSTKAGK